MARAVASATRAVQLAASAHPTWAELERRVYGYDHLALALALALTLTLALALALALAQALP